MFTSSTATRSRTESRSELSDAESSDTYRPAAGMSEFEVAADEEPPADLDIIQHIGADVAAQQCRSKHLTSNCAEQLTEHRCQTALGATRTVEFRTQLTAEQKLSNFQGNLWVDACECFVECSATEDCVAFDNYQGVCRLFAECSLESSVAPATGTTVWSMVNTDSAAIAGSCSNNGFTEQFFDVDLLFLALVLSCATNFVISSMSRGLGSGTAGLDEQSWLATHWNRMLARDAQQWNNPRTFHIAGKISRFQNRLEQKIKPRQAGMLQSLVKKCVPGSLSLFADKFTAVTAQVVRLVVYLPFVVANWGRSLASVPDLGAIGNVFARRLFALPDVGAGSLSLLSFLLLADVAFRCLIGKFVNRS